MTREGKGRRGFVGVVRVRRGGGVLEGSEGEGEGQGEGGMKVGLGIFWFFFGVKIGFVVF